MLMLSREQRAPSGVVQTKVWPCCLEVESKAKRVAPGGGFSKSACAVAARQQAATMIIFFMSFLPRQKSKQFLFEKKNQKTFIHCARYRIGPDETACRQP
jgi:hypothetical protein